MTVRYENLALISLLLAIAKIQFDYFRNIGSVVCIGFALKMKRKNKNKIGSKIEIATF